jgi:3-hydroxymyristoyl/3-hydroxydecanoyl-(acyl carrier protein) dehydratase
VLPHAFPFRLVDRTGGRAALPLLWTVNAALGRGAAEVPAVLAIEMMAQAALVLLAGEAGGGPGEGAGLLAGVDGVTFHAPLAAGDRLEAHAELAGRFGRLLKVRGRLTRDGATVVEGDLLLALG